VVGSAVRQVLKLILLTSFLLVMSMGFAGLMVWCATARTEDFYARAAFRSDSLLSLWIRPSKQGTGSHWGEFIQADMSIWLNPSRTKKAFSNFDDWYQEYSLLKEETYEYDEGETRILPSFPVYPEQDAEESLEFAEEDAYDASLATLIDDLWTSGFLSLSGSLHLDVPLWAKPFAGLSAVSTQMGLSSAFLETFADRFSLRADGADLPSWIAEIPFSEVEGRTSPVREIVLDVGGREVGEFFARLCELGNLAEEYCAFDDVDSNPLSPLLMASEGFHVQLKIYWSLRGQHFVWSNSRDCLDSLISQPLVRTFQCGELRSEENEVSQNDLVQLMNFKNAIMSPDNRTAGVWLNQHLLKNAVRKMFSVLQTEDIHGAEVLRDFLNQSVGERFLQNIHLSLVEWAHRWPLWSTELEHSGSDTGRLLIHARRRLRVGEHETLQTQAAARHFTFLHALMSAWLGLPSSTSRLTQSKPWEKVGGFWRTESVYRLGWSEQE